LNELNTWLEKFVLNSTNEISSMSKRLTAIVGSDPDNPNENGEKTIGMPDLVADMHSMMADQKTRQEHEGTVNQRLDSLLQMMAQDHERHASHTGMVEQVISALDRQRGDNEVLMRALATGQSALGLRRVELTFRFDC
jgi:folate-binding Fe-S cluster repair protein YgfZ